MNKQAGKQMTITLHEIEVDHAFTFEELCEACQTTPDFIHHVIEFGVIEPQKNNFTLQHLRRVRKVLQLQQDLEVNLAGAALAIELTEQMERMQQKIEWLEKHWGAL